MRTPLAYGSSLLSCCLLCPSRCCLSLCLLPTVAPSGLPAYACAAPVLLLSLPVLSAAVTALCCPAAKGQQDAQGGSSEPPRAHPRSNVSEYSAPCSRAHEVLWGLFRMLCVSPPAYGRDANCEGSLSRDNFLTKARM
jgi:hypothetical protein